MFLSLFSLCKSRKCVYFFKRHSSVKTTIEASVNNIWENLSVKKYMTAYEDLVGLTEVKNAQNKVLEAEAKFLNVQVERRSKHLQLTGVQTKLKELNTELDKVQRGDDRYLALLTQEHSIIREENTLLEEIQKYEELERTYFAALSSAVRESHERERTRAERTKYWSVTASVIGAMLGIFGTSINNYLRMRELKRMIREQGEGSDQTKETLNTISKQIADHASLVRSVINDLKVALGQEPIQIASTSSNHQTTEEPTNEQTLQEIISNQKNLEGSIKEIHGILCRVKIYDNSENLTFAGPEMREALASTEKNLETRMRRNAFFTVVFVYAAVAVTLMLKGS